MADAKVLQLVAAILAVAAVGAPEIEQGREVAAVAGLGKAVGQLQMHVAPLGPGRCIAPTHLHNDDCLLPSLYTIAALMPCRPALQVKQSHQQPRAFNAAFEVLPGAEV